MEPRNLTDPEAIPSPVKLILIALLGVAAAFALAACTLQRCSEGAVCDSRNAIGGPSAVPSPTPTPSASPSPSATPKAESCDIDYMVLQPRDGITLASGQSARVSLTPYRRVTNPDGSVAQVEVSEACNLPRVNSIAWASTSVSVVIGTGFEPSVTRVGVGVASVTATLEGRVSNPVVIR